MDCPNLLISHHEAASSRVCVFNTGASWSSLAKLKPPLCGTHRLIVDGLHWEPVLPRLCNFFCALLLYSSPQTASYKADISYARISLDASSDSRERLDDPALNDGAEGTCVSPKWLAWLSGDLHVGSFPIHLQSVLQTTFATAELTEKEIGSANQRSTKRGI